MTDIEIARSTKLEEIEVVASKYGIPAKELEHYGHYMAKVPTRLIDEERVMCEMAVSAYRAGADIYITYFAKELAECMQKGLIG